jgi:hypothetical protein
LRSLGFECKTTSRQWEVRCSQIAFFESVDLNGLRRFLEEHPSYSKVYDADSARIEALLRADGLRVDDLVEVTRTELAAFVDPTAVASVG